MIKHNLPRNISLSILTAILIIFQSEISIAQAQHESGKTAKLKTSLSTSFQYQNVTNRLDMRSIGLSLEFFVWDSVASDIDLTGYSEPVSFSVSFTSPVYYGRGSNNINYIHVPVGGSVLVAWLAYATLYSGENQFAGIKGLTARNVLLLLITENINFNFAVSERFTLSPYLSLFSVDIAINKKELNESDQNQVGNLWSSGLGLNIKMFLNKRLAVAPNVSYRYFYLSGENKGYSAGIHFAYNF